MIQWFPGHMAKALREMEEKVKLVDLVMILLDARIPSSSVNPELLNIFKNKKIIYVFTKTDKADTVETLKWVKKYQTDNSLSICVDARNKKCIKDIEKLVDVLMKSKFEKDAARGIKPRPVKTMIVGIPNVGKSTLINTLVGKKVANVADKPGVTKSQQWIRINSKLDLLDTPGVLWPKFDNQTVGYHLAICGSIKEDVLPLEDVGIYFVNFLNTYYKNLLPNRFGIDDIEELDSYQILNLIAKKLNFTTSTSYDIDKTVRYILQNFRNDLIGKVTLDRYEEI